MYLVASDRFINNTWIQIFTPKYHTFKLKPIAYHIAYGIASVMELIVNTILLGKESIFTRYTLGLLAFSQTLNITAAVQELGYKLRVSIEKRLDIFAKWWQEK
ncbi:MAG: hypothetical protein EA343_10335 [Nodularia sp. (in: Bacteria)]|nr:MAG: hypothetical protein EA343_10335 [Nodularia sp. (in: cyanobacteria)]